MQSIQYDIVIVGGGPAGLAAGILLAQNSDLKIGIIEQGNFRKTKIGETLPPQCLYLLHQLGIWKSFENGSHYASPGMASAWHNQTLGFNDHIYNPGGHGWHLNRSVFENDLLDQARLYGVVIHVEHKLINSELKDDTWHLGILNKIHKSIDISCSYVIDASGRNSRFAKNNGVGKIETDNLVGNFQLFKANGVSKNGLRQTLIEAVEIGWWYSAPLQNEHMIVGLMTDADIMIQLKSQKADKWNELLLLTHYTKTRVRELLPKGTMINRSAKTERLSEFTGNRWAAIGDAAMAFDPLSAQGIAKALFNAQQISCIIPDAIQGNNTGIVGYNAHLESYYKNFIKTRNHFYNQVQRWPDTAFWKRRHDELFLESVRKS